MEIAGRHIGYGNPCFLIAELSANHDQDMKKAVRLIHEAKEAGADAVKLQTYTPDTLVNKDSPYYSLYKRAYMPWKWQPELKKLADDLDIVLFSTAYDKTSVDFLKKMDMPAYKIASFELTNHRLIKYALKQGKPVILSTGMAKFGEINDLMLELQPFRDRLAVLKCTSTYPAPAKDMNLGAIPQMQKLLDVTIGLSNHSVDRAIPIVAVALGAHIVEQHITLSKDSIDSAFSLLPDQFADMVQDVRIAEQSMGYRLQPTESEKPMMALRWNPKTKKRGA